MRGYGRNKEGDCQDSLIFKRVKNINNRLITKPFSPDYERLSWREIRWITGHIFSDGGCYHSISKKLSVIEHVLKNGNGIHLLPKITSKKSFWPFCSG